jgi:hypothetical protein
MEEFKTLRLNSEAPILSKVIVNTKPVQDTAQDHTLKEFYLGGPSSDRDVRMVLDVHTLEYLLETARQSPTKRCIINRAGIRIKVKRAHTGHVYETLHIDGLRPYPEQAPTNIRMPYDAMLGNSLLRNRR